MQFFTLCVISIFLSLANGAEDGDVRLIDGTDKSGILEVFHDGIWGAVCNYNFDWRDADVVCYQLGFFRSISYQNYYYSGQFHANKFFWLSFLGCGGSEKAITSCSHSGWGIHGCDEYKHVRITCQNTPCDVISSNGDCFVVSNQYLNWTEAEDNCVAHGGHLATIRSYTENQNLRNSFYRYDMWIGLYYAGSSQYQWIDGSSYSYRYFDSYYSSNDYCGGTYYNNYYYWRTYTCNTRMRSVCRIPVSNVMGCRSCDANYNGKCIFGVSSRVTWQTAQSYCQIWGGNLVSMHSPEEKAYINRYVSYSSFYNFYNSYYYNMWIGLNDISSEGNFVWTDGTPYDYYNFEYTPSSSYDCVLSNYYSPNYWHSYSCSNTYPFICSIPAFDPSNLIVVDHTENHVTLEWNITTSNLIDHYLLVYGTADNRIEISLPTSRSTYILAHPSTDYDYTVSIARCTTTCCSHNNSYIRVQRPEVEDFYDCQVSDCDFELNGDCYRFELLQLSWSVAEDRCNDWGGHLTSIRSSQEQIAIVTAIPNSLSSSYIWIGLNDTRAEGSFKWIDGSLSSYTYWRYSSPNINVAEDCVALDFPTAYWEDLTCTSLHYSLCRKPIPMQILSVASFTATQVGADYATLNWLPIPGQSIDRYILTIEDLGSNKKQLIPLSSCVTSYSVNPLLSLTTYSLTLYACNSLCCNNSNTQIMLTTSNTGFLPIFSTKPKNVSAVALDSSSIIVTWEAPCNTRLVAITQYKLYYYGLTSDTAVRQVSLPATDLHYTLTGLEQDTAYTLKAVAVSSAGESTSTDINYIRTQELGLGQSCYLPDCDTELNGKCFKFVTTLKTWMDAETQCVAWNGHLATISSETENNAVGSITNSLSNTWIGLNDIAQERNYEWVDGSTSSYRKWNDISYFSYYDCVSMRTASGSYTWDDLDCSSLYSFVCSKPIPVQITAPMSFASTGVGSNYIRLRWEFITLPNLRNYLLAVKTGEQKSAIISLSTCTSSYTLQQLYMSTTYSLSLYSCSSTCCNSTGSVISVTTSSVTMDSFQVTPNSPENLVANPINASSIMITWDNPCNDNLLTVAYYKVTYNGLRYDTLKRIITVAATSDSASSIILSNLRVFTAYSIKVAAINSAGESPIASVDYVATIEGVPTGAPRAINLIDITTNSSIVLWSPPDYSQQNGLLSNYMLRLTNADSSELIEEYTTLNSDEVVKKFINLNQGTAYILNIAAGTLEGFGPFADFTFMTERVPSPFLNSELDVKADYFIESSKRLAISIGWTADPQSLSDNAIRYIVSIRILNTIIKEITVTSPPAYTIISLDDFSYAAANGSIYSFIINVCEEASYVCAREIEFLWSLSGALSTITTKSTTGSSNSSGTDISIISPTSSIASVAGNVQSNLLSSVSDTQAALIVVGILIIIIAVLTCCTIFGVLIVISRKKRRPNFTNQPHHPPITNNTQGAYFHNEIYDNIPCSMQLPINQSRGIENPIFDDSVDIIAKKSPVPVHNKSRSSLEVIYTSNPDLIEKTTLDDKPESVIVNPEADMPDNTGETSI